MSAAAECTVHINAIRSYLQSIYRFLQQYRHMIAGITAGCSRKISAMVILLTHLVTVELPDHCQATLPVARSY